MDLATIIAKARSENRKVLDELAGKKLLADFGVAVPKSAVVTSTDAIGAAFSSLTPPLVLKVMSANIVHKSDVGGVKVGLKSAVEAIEAMRQMTAVPAIREADVDAFPLEEMAPAGQEIAIGGVRDPDFGPLIMVGLGGILVEILGDVAFRICPIARIDAVEMLTELKGAPILDGARGRKPASREAIIDALLKIGGEDGLLLRHADDFKEVDINPLIASESAVVAVDARFVLS